MASIAFVPAKLGSGAFTANGYCSDRMSLGKGATHCQKNGGKACKQRGMVHLAPDIAGARCGQDRVKLRLGRHPPGQNVRKDMPGTVVGQLPFDQKIGPRKRTKLKPGPQH
jgi:hypothetical protein